MNQPGTKEIITSRLILRLFRKDDIKDVYENYGKDPKVSRFINYAPCATLESTTEFINMHLENYISDPAFFGWAITLNDVVIGSIGLFNVDEFNEQCELGYSLGSRWWGNGYATEAASAVLEYGFKTVGAHRIYASHHIENTASGNVLRKIGMKEEGILCDGQKNSDGTFSDLKLYAKVAQKDI